MLVWLPVALLSFHAPTVHFAARTCLNAPCMSEDATDPATPVAAGDEAAAPPAAPGPKSSSYNLKEDAKEQGKKGVGFNQFDPVLSATSFISRRFGLAGGLGLVALLAATEGNEILKAVLSTGPVEGTGEVITTASGLQYIDVLIAQSGDTAKPGNVVGFNAKVSIGDSVLFDSTAGKEAKPIAFKFGQRPFQNVVCEGVEEGIKSMKPGSKRKLLVPKALAPAGVNLPDGVPLTYEIELLEVLPGYF